MNTKAFLIATAILGLSCAALGEPAATLKDAYKGAFVVGAAINADQSLGLNAKAQAVLTTQFNAISPENDLKWERIHPTLERYDFRVPDAYVDLGVKNHMYVVGHVLVWHNQTPAWVFQDQNGNPLSRTLLLERLRAHILTVVGRYRGRINAWDVVNEALNEDGTLRQSQWYKILGEDYIAAAFRFAHEADPNAELAYNDYSIENPAKRAGAVALIKKLKAEGVPITTVGIQGHYDLTWPSVQLLDETISDFAKLGVKVAITELDVGVLPAPDKQHTAEVTLRFGADPALNPYAGGLPDAVSALLAKRYGELFAVFYKHRDVVDRVTLWGISDKDTWRNDWPVKGRTDYPMLFDRSYEPKAALRTAIQAAGN